MRRLTQRPGKRERARVKKCRRAKAWHSSWGAGTELVKLGRKKMSAIFSSVGGLPNRKPTRNADGPNKGKSNQAPIISKEEAPDDQA